MLALLLAVAIPAGPATPSPPPIIVTTKTSTLCAAVRSYVAPAIAGLIAQDHMIDRGRGLIRDMAATHSAGADAWVELDNMRLLGVVDGVAQNNIKVHQLLDQLKKVVPKDSVEASELSSLRSRLLTIADAQAESLNFLSGTADTEALNEIEGFKNPAAAMLQPDARQTPSAESTNAPGEDQSPPPPDSSSDLAAKESVTDRRSRAPYRGTLPLTAALRKPR